MCINVLKIQFVQPFHLWCTQSIAILPVTFLQHKLPVHVINFAVVFVAQ